MAILGNIVVRQCESIAKRFNTYPAIPYMIFMVFMGHVGFAAKCSAPFEFITSMSPLEHRCLFEYGAFVGGFVGVATLVILFKRSMRQKVQ